MLPDWGGAATTNGVLPPWAQELTRACDWYTFTTMQVHEGRAVVAIKSGDHSGPLLVITSNEEEMRDALGLKPRRSSQ
jgi:hypothetical protein